MRDLINSMFDKVYCINMPSAHARRMYMKMQLDKLNIPFEFYNAADVSSLFDKVQWRTIKFLSDTLGTDYRPYSIQQFGCLLSHYQIMRLSLSAGYNHILIIEDDTAFIKQKNIIKDYIQAAPKDFDVLKFELVFSHDNSENDYTTWQNKWISVKDTNIDEWCLTGCYALSQRAMQTYITNVSAPSSKPVVIDCIDYVFRHLQTSRLNMYIPNKALCLQQQYVHAKRWYSFMRCAEIDPIDFMCKNGMEKCINYDD